MNYFVVCLDVGQIGTTDSIDVSETVVGAKFRRQSI